MKYVQKTIEFLQLVATNLTANALNHKTMSKIFATQGFGKLADKYAEHATEEFGFVERFQDRILDLDGEIRQEAIPARVVCSDIEDYLAYDLQQSVEGLPIIEEVINAGYLDLTSYDLMKEYYKDEEEDLNWTKSQIDLIKAIGKPNYLTTVL
ncbi:bacterioferritin [Cricetibacter osteomyelitidis]|uniref:Bacterioferritin n=1 Tax=Cricetibacter osteomyelitidis TaxID=1521931 RepID=A0A4R2SZN5_9PAST|nr:ferritin-like domain-containing protein [Cricetibacter osteomyelitidis]TCP96007.1 bacterioferritin [Cricetibacter osteomyelitidis]